MEGLSGEGTRRRREHTEDTEVRRPTAEEMERVKERILESIDLSEKREVSTKEYADKIVREISEEEKISHEGKDAIEDLERMKEFCESIERRKAEALEAIDLSRREERGDSPKEQDESGDSHVEEIRSQEEEREVEIARRKEAILEKLERRKETNESLEIELGRGLEKNEQQEKMEVVGCSLEGVNKTDDSHFGETRTQEEYVRDIENHSELKLRRSFEMDDDEAVAYTESLEQYLESEEVDNVEKVERLEKPESQEPKQEVPSKLQELDEEWVRNVTNDLVSKEWTREGLAKQLSEISRSLPDSSRMFYIDIEQSLGLSPKELDSFERTFQQTRECLDEAEGVRFGLVGERLYVWKPDLESTGLEKVYDSLYYYFRDRQTFERYVEDVGESMGLRDKSLRDIRRHLKELAPQMVTEDSEDYCFNHRLRRIRGDYVSLMNDISGKKLSDLDGEISKLTKPSGRGGITNPRFPEGEIYEVALSRLIAVAISDCHLKPNGTLGYAESELSRIKIVERELQVFGDIILKPKFIESDNLYITYFPTPLGVMLERLGIPSGDRSVQNPGLVSVIKEFSLRARCALIEDLVPQDGTISGKRIQWTHTNVLDAASKSEVYGIEPKVGDSEIGLIKKHGKKERYSWVLNYGKLQSLQYSSDANIRQVANDLWNCVFENPNRLIEDQIDIVRSLGVEYRSKPYTIRFHERTSRVSVAWTAEPESLLESIKLGMMAPSNDVVKKKIMKEIIKSHPKYVREAMKHFRSHEIEVHKWWDDE
jgi:hypothetical protein